MDADEKNTIILSRLQFFFAFVVSIVTWYLRNNKIIQKAITISLLNFQAIKPFELSYGSLLSHIKVVEIFYSF